MEFRNDDQLRHYLKSEAKRLGISTTNAYSTFFALMLLNRICDYNKEELVVKGSFSEIAHLGHMIRPVTDIDLVSREEHNNPLLVLYQAMYKENEPVNYELFSLPKTSNTGMHKLSLTAEFGKIKHPISVDFMELSKTLYDIETKKVYNPFRGMPDFYVNTPTYEEHLAEKLCIVAESQALYSEKTRLKDFYDIYKLQEKSYDYDKLCDYFARMIVDRNKVSIDNLSSDYLDEDFYLNHVGLWMDMSSKYEFLDHSFFLDKAMYLTRDILEDQITRVRKKN